VKVHEVWTGRTHQHAEVLYICELVRGSDGPPRWRCKWCHLSRHKHWQLLFPTWLLLSQMLNVQMLSFSLLRQNSKCQQAYAYLIPSKLELFPQTKGVILPSLGLFKLCPLWFFFSMKGTSLSFHNHAILIFPCTPSSLASISWCHTLKLVSKVFCLKAFFVLFWAPLPNKHNDFLTSFETTTMYKLLPAAFGLE